MRRRFHRENPYFVALRLACTSAVLLLMATSAPAADLPLTKVVLFNSGVSYFEHLGEVEGDRQLELKFNVEQVNDLLKSLVLQDFGGGRVEAVGYGSKVPAARILRTFTIDLTRDPTLADLLQQIRGESVELQAPTSITGTILGVERRQSRSGKDVITEQVMLNLLTKSGLRSVPLDSVTEIRLLNEKLNDELNQALAMLADDHAGDEKKSVKIRFSGKGKRPVRVGYIQESPIWKTSYRLVLDDKKKPFLQGWAIVENTTENDWHDVALTLVSGRPISFVMDLYQPLYLDRPLVVPELFASLRPRTYDQDLAAREQQFQAAGQPAALPVRRPGFSGFSGMGGGMGAMGGGMGGGMGMGGGFGGAGGGALSTPNRRLDLGEGVRSAATAGDCGELFRYEISSAVSIPRQQSAMLPIVNESVEARKLSIFNPDVDAKHPLNGLRLTNATKLHLMQGPITIFDDGEYAGDAQIEDIAPGGKRLLSYALDLDVEVALTDDDWPEELIDIRIAHGLVSTRKRARRSHDYVIRNSDREPRKLLIEYAHDAEWTLTAPPQPTEETRRLYRFEVEAQPGEPKKFAIAEEQITEASVKLTNLSDDTLIEFRKANAAGPGMKKALEELLALKKELATLTAKLEAIGEEETGIEREQSRMRKNMEQLDSKSNLYQRYVKTLTEQEDRIAELHDQWKTLISQQRAQQRKVNEFIAGLYVE